MVAIAGFQERDRSLVPGVAKDPGALLVALNRGSELVEEA